MEKRVGPMMKRFFGSMSEEDRQRMKACCEEMAMMCPCTTMAEGPESVKKRMMESMKSFCDDKMGMMSIRFNRTNVQSDQSESSDET